MVRNLARMTRMTRDSHGSLARTLVTLDLIQLLTDMASHIIGPYRETELSSSERPSQL